MNNIYEILTPLWAVKYTKLIDSLSSKLGAIARQFEQYINCEIVVAAVVLRAVFLWVDFYAVTGVAIIKNANFPNLQRTKIER